MLYSIIIRTDTDSSYLPFGVFVLFLAPFFVDSRRHGFVHRDTRQCGSLTPTCPNTVTYCRQDTYRHAVTYGSSAVMDPSRPARGSLNSLVFDLPTTSHRVLLCYTYMSTFRRTLAKAFPDPCTRNRNPNCIFDSCRSLDQANRTRWCSVASRPLSEFFNDVRHEASHGPVPWGLF